MLRLTSYVTGRHKGLKRKLWAGYRMPSLQQTGWLPSPVTKTEVTCCDAFSSVSVVSHAFSALCVYPKFGHHPHPLGYLCAKFRFFRSLHCSAGPRRKIAYSVTHPACFICWEPKLSLRNNVYAWRSTSQAGRRFQWCPL